MTCETCGHEMAVGEWPYCPHGRGSGLSVVGDDPFIGGVKIENLGHTPQTVYSRAEYRAAMSAAGLKQFVRHVGVPGSDKSPFTTRWI